MRLWLVLLVLASGCDPGTLGHRADAGVPGADAAVSDAGAGSDAAASSDSAALVDAAGPGLDAFVAPTDAAPSCTPTRTSCNAGGLECGLLANGCPGGTYDCGPCGDGIETCEILTSMFQTRVYNCIQMVQSANDSWFDATMFRDTNSWLVLDAHASEYVAAVQACVDGGGRVAIVDPGAPGNEIRVRPDAGGGAENFIVRTYGTGRTAARYTSTCSPPGF
jgi:hypothetical protein